MLVAFAVFASPCGVVAASGGGGGCGAGVPVASCEAHLQSLVDRLESSQDQIQGKLSTLSTLEQLRSSILGGRRVELQSAQRQHLEKGSPLVGEVTYDMRHRPVSTNTSRYFRLARTVARHLEVAHHALVPVQLGKASGDAGDALLAIVDSSSELSVFDLDGRPLLENFELGHAQGVTIDRLLVSKSQDSPLVLTTDSTSRIRVHSLKVEARVGFSAGVGRGENGTAEDSEEYLEPSSLVLAPKLACAFKLPASPLGGEARLLTTMLIVEHGGQTHFVAGDSAGGITVFSHRGFLRGRIRVTEEPGGVRGLVKSQGNSVLFYSARVFGHLAVAKVDLEYPPCSGPASPIAYAIIDLSYSASRVILSLEDGDIVVFNTARGPSRACDLAMKFPHVSPVPFQLYVFKGYVVGMPRLLRNSSQQVRSRAPSRGTEVGRSGDHAQADLLPELFVFNLAAMDNGYGVAPSRSVQLQASFDARGPAALSMLPSCQGKTAPMAFRFASTKGIRIYNVSLRPARKSKVALEEAVVEESTSWTSWYAKGIAVLLVAMLLPLWYWRRRRRVANAAADAAAAAAAAAAVASDEGADAGADKENQRRRRNVGGRGQSGHARDAGARPKVEEDFDDDDGEVDEEEDD